MSNRLQPEIAKQLGVEANPKCVCATPLDTMACPWGHVDGCHYPKECWQARCEHFLSTADPDYYPEIFYELADEPLDRCDVCHEYIDFCQCGDDEDD